MTEDELREKINQILSEEQRVVANILLDNTIPQMQLYYQNKIDELRKQLLNEKIENLNRYEIAITVCEREKVSLLEEYFYVMDMADVKNGAAIELGNLKIPVWIAEDDKCMNQYMANGIRGYIHTNVGDIAVEFKVIRNTSYLDVLERCKKSFALNGLSCKNVNDAYLHKYYYLEANISDLDTEMEIQGYTLECEELVDKIHDNMIPLWNVRYLTMQANDFPVMQEDKIWYRYDFVLTDNVEMIIDMPEYTKGYCIRYADTLSFFTDNNDNRQFSFWEIRSNDYKTIRSDYLILTNGVSDNMWSTLGHSEIVHSVWEVNRKIKALVISDSISYQGCQVQDSYAEGLDYVFAKEPNSVLSMSNKRNYLELMIENIKIPNYIYRNVIQYIVDSTQLAFREYIVICRIDVI